MFLLAHLSDPHLSVMPRPRLFQLANKRAIGLVNWRLRRRQEHRADVLQAILSDMAAQAPAHVAVTGDLVNVALPGEFTPARQFLESIGPPERVTFVPGNHDAYVRAAAGARALHWGEYLTGDPPADRKLAQFPFIRRRGEVALIGLSTAVPTGPFMAWGKLGRDQLRRLGEVLSALKAEALFRIVLLHHPPVRLKGDRFKDLVDMEEFQEILREHGAELVLHGHSHLRSVAWLGTSEAPIPAVGVPSASAVGDHNDPAAYNLFQIEAAANAWRCEMVERGLSGAGPIAELARRTLHPVPSR